MCIFCPADGCCGVCGHVPKQVSLDRVYFQAGRTTAVVLHGTNRESLHQQCGGGRRVIRKKVGGR